MAGLEVHLDSVQNIYSKHNFKIFQSSSTVPEKVIIRLAAKTV